MIVSPAMTKVPVLAIFLAVVFKHVLVALWPHYKVFRSRYRAPALVLEGSAFVFLILPIVAVIFIAAMDGLFPKESLAVTRALIG